MRCTRTRNAWSERRSAPSSTRRSSHSSRPITGGGHSRWSSSHAWGHWGYWGPIFTATGVPGSVKLPTGSSCRNSNEGARLRRLARGEKIGCFGLPEPDHGSDPAGMVTKAVRRGDGYVLNGNKLWITNGSIADVAVVWARTEEGIRGFLVEKGTPGFSAREIHGKFSLRASITSELIFQDCRIPSAR